MFTYNQVCFSIKPFLKVPNILNVQFKKNFSFFYHFVHYNQLESLETAVLTRLNVYFISISPTPFNTIFPEYIYRFIYFF